MMHMYIFVVSLHIYYISALLLLCVNLSNIVVVVNSSELCCLSFCDEQNWSVIMLLFALSDFRLLFLLLLSTSVLSVCSLIILLIFLTFEYL